MEYQFDGHRTGRVVRLPGLVAVLWLGVLIGVSFLATPVKFQAPSLDLPTALDVGRVTFALSSKVEWGLWVLLAMTAALSRVRVAAWGLVFLLGAGLAIQSFWLLPILDERVGRIIAGLPVESAPHHLIYVAVEGAKALLLVVMTLVSTGRVRAEESFR